MSAVAPIAAPTPVATARFARAYVVTMRPYLLFVSGITGLAGVSLGPDIGLAKTLILALAFFLSYGFGQALTDCFQLDTDALSSPYRPMVQGAIRRRDVLIVSLTGLAFCGTVVVAFSRANLFLAALTVIGLATYTPFKRRWWGGPIYNAWIVALLVPMGYLAAAGTLDLQAVDRLTWWKIVGTILTTFWAYANFVLSGYFKDVSADRTTGYHTLPVRFGWRWSAAVSHAFAALSVVSCTWTIALADSWTALPFLGAGIFATALGQIRLQAVRREREAHRAIAPVVHGFVLLESAIAAAFRPEWTLILVAFYTVFCLVMEHRPSEAQI
ncbi:MAG: UbiA family prenyltransferase [Gemmatimonadetes bacterium]|nr:UbiA family prenyltransferase [Gemmatimonadota bacterium]